MILSISRLPLLFLSLMIIGTPSTVILDRQQNQLQQQQHRRLLENNVSESKQENKVQVTSTETKPQQLVGKQEEEPKYTTRYPGDAKREIKPENPKKDDKPKSDEEEVEENPKDFYFYLFDEDSAVVEIEGPVNEDEKDEPPFLFDPKPGQIRIVEFYAQ